MYERPPTIPFQNSPRNTTFPSQRYTLMFQQHQDESIYDAWTHFKDLIQRVPHYGLDLLEAIENFAQGQKEWDNPPNIISEQEVANLKAQAKRLFGNENVWVEMHRGIAWNKVENLNPQSTPQVLPSFEEYTLLVTHPEEVEGDMKNPDRDDPKKHYGFKPGLLGQGGSLCVDLSNWENRVGNANPGQARQIKCYSYNRIWHIARNCTQPKRPLNSEYFKDKMLLMQAQENGVVLDKEQLLFIAGGQDNAVDDNVDEPPVQHMALTMDNFFQADQCDAFDSDVDEAATAQTMFIANLSSADPIYDEVGPSYDSDILSEVQDHDNYQDAVDEHHEVHEIHNDYVKDNAEPVVQSNVSFVPNDDYMMIINEMHEQDAQCVSANEQNKVVNASLTIELARYKKQVEMYERRARFELNEREQKIDEQLRIIITDRNIKEESLKKELHSVKIQLNSTINHNKSIVEEVTTLKKDFKQKENKYLEDFLDMKALKEKVADKLFKQDHSLQTVHMLCKPKPYYDEKKKVAIGYKSPLYLTRAKQVQHALYNGHELVKTNHTRAVVHDSKDTLDIAKKTRIGMLEKMKSTLWVDSKIKITPSDYSKENYLATFTPHRQLTPEQIF
ncbi:hypothetical protein Tco_1476176 [Tanacetum coccineum]